jgi:hypothetical protein
MVPSSDSEQGMKLASHSFLAYLREGLEGVKDSGGVKVGVDFTSMYETRRRNSRSWCFSIC